MIVSGFSVPASRLASRRDRLICTSAEHRGCYKMDHFLERLQVSIVHVGFDEAGLGRLSTFRKVGVLYFPRNEGATAAHS